jgi:diaminohydroxyphosphoribosylaminopyrimidine deaminase/5-amino-6-(5-phosphoribosylamino)uracil reductase
MPEILFPCTPTGLKSPLRVVVDADLKLPSKLRVFDAESVPTVVVAAEDASIGAESKLSELGVEVIRVPGQGGRLDLWAAMEMMAEKGIQSLLIEGGGEAAGMFFDADLIDEVNIFFAPIIIGGRTAVPMVGGEGVARLIDAKKLSDFRTQRIGADLLVVGKILHE